MAAAVTLLGGYSPFVVPWSATTPPMSKAMASGVIAGACSESSSLMIGATALSLPPSNVCPPMPRLGSRQKKASAGRARSPPPPLPPRWRSQPAPPVPLRRKLGSSALLLGVLGLAIQGNDLDLDPIPLLPQPILLLLYGAAIGGGLAKPLLEVLFCGLHGHRPHLPQVPSCVLHLLLLQPLGNLLGGGHGRGTRSGSSSRTSCGAKGFGRGGQNVRGSGPPLGRPPRPTQLAQASPSSPSSI